MRTESAVPSPVHGICPEEFVSALSEGPLEEVLRIIGTRWTGSQVIDLLKHSSPDVRKVAALALSAVGDRSAVVPLAVALHDADPMVSRMAEHSMWSVWFRLGAPAAVNLVKGGNTHMHHGNYACAIEKFTQAIQVDNTFAEAFNQRAIAYYLSERFAQSVNDCRSALVRMPQHFGAMAGMGHCHLHMGQWREAKRCYRLALAIHPGMEGIEASLAQIDQVLRDNPTL